MKRIFVFATALAAGLATSTLAAQAPAAAPAAAAVTPQAVPAKIAIIAFEEAVVRTNEGQRAVADIQKKYEPKKGQIDTQAKEVDTLKAQLQALPANAPDDQRATLIKNIDTKEKNLQRDAEDAQNSYQSDLQEAYGKVAQKVGGEAVKYVQANGFTLLLNVGGNQQTANPVLWALPETDITQAVVNAYNKVSGVVAPPPSAPAPAVHRATPPSK
jgi:outer membrane protein